MDREKLINFYKKYTLTIGLIGQTACLFQVYEILKKQSSQNVSLYGTLVSYLSILTWLFYGYFTKEWTIFRVNLFGAITGGVCILVICLFR
jgi:uncharacterized protein with PQ loop repeat